MRFDGKEKIIGRGAQAEVFLYHDFAYKVYKSTYPAEWISFEKDQQAQVNKAGLCSVKYYDTDDSHIIKMDFVDGDTLENVIRDCLQGKTVNGISDVTDGFKLLAAAHKFVHSVDINGLNIPHLRDTAAMGMTEDASKKILSIIDKLSGKFNECVCHLDLHFLNIMLPRNNQENKQTNVSSEYTIIDWMNARIAPPVFDYARTYVIFNEFSKDALELYKQLVLPDVWKSGISESDFADAIEVCAAIREQEKK